MNHILTIRELQDIDQFYGKADPVLREARKYVESFDWDWAVRRSQEALELSIKSIFRFIRKDYPKDHDLEKHLYEIAKKLKEYDVTAEEVALMVLANATLTLWRLPAFYGDEKLHIGKLFSEKEARLALWYAERVHSMCYRVRDRLYRSAPHG